jgi:cytochrome c biogenesis protein CcmG/thiol:disulfide interchange protein DsbE
MRRSGRDRANPKHVVLLATRIVLSLGLVGLRSASAVEPAPAAPPIAPDFSREDLDHREVHLAAYRGKVVLLNFWATWCSPCLSEVPRFVQWQRKYGGRGLQIVGVSMDDDEAPVRAACRKYALNYPVVMGDEKLGELYGGVLGLPMTFLIDGNGRIRFTHEGATKLDVLEREIRELLPRP